MKICKIIFYILFFCTLAAPDHSNAAENMLLPGDKYFPLYQAVASKYNIPLSLLLSIAKQESGFNPWAVNIAGRSYFPATKEEAVALVAANRDQGYDVGLMQINKWWIEERLRLKLEDVFEPEVNIHLAGWILNENFHSYGNTWKVIGAYHASPLKKPDRALDYAKSVTKSFEEFIRLRQEQGNSAVP